MQDPPGPDMIPDPTGAYPGAVQGRQGQLGFLGAGEGHHSPARLVNTLKSTVVYTI